MKAWLASLALVLLSGCSSPYQQALSTAELLPPPSSNGSADARAAEPYDRSPDLGD